MPATKQQPDARVTSGEIRGLGARIRATSRDAREEHDRARNNLGGVGARMRQLSSELKEQPDADAVGKEDR
jgi:hypothetical protein